MLKRKSSFPALLLIFPCLFSFSGDVNYVVFEKTHSHTFILSTLTSVNALKRMYDKKKISGPGGGLYKRKYFGSY